MSTVVGTIISPGAFAGQQVNIELPTVRVNELPDAVDLQDTDLMIVYQNNGNKTTKSTLGGIKDWIATGGGDTTTTPVVYGADVEIVITEDHLDGRVDVPILANKMFALERRNIGSLLTNEYYILPSGGFELRLKDADGNVVEDDDPDGIPQVVHAGEVFIAHVFDLVANTPPANTYAGRFTGIANISVNTQLAEAHRYKLIHAAFGSSHGVITLEDIADAPANSEVVIETMVTNNFDTKVICTSGQKIYCLNTSNDYLYLGRSESISLLRGSDGWYVTSPVEMLLKVGKPEYGYVQGINQLICKGQPVNRADYPRLWEKVQSFGASLVSDATWNTVTTITGAVAGTRSSYKPYEGCFSSGDGSTTFRLPNLQEKFIRGLNNIGSSDTERTVNDPGGIQPDSIKNFKIGAMKAAVAGGNSGVPNMTILDTNIVDPFNGGNVDFPITLGYESRGINAGLLPLINT